MKTFFKGSSDVKLEKTLCVFKKRKEGAAKGTDKELLPVVHDDLLLLAKDKVHKKVTVVPKQK